MKWKRPPRIWSLFFLFLLAAPAFLRAGHDPLPVVRDAAREKELKRLRQLEGHYERAVGMLVFGGSVAWKKDGRTHILEAPISSGSAFIVSADGHLLTNFHVVEDLNEMRSIQKRLAQSLTQKFGVSMAVNYDLLFYIRGEYLFVDLVQFNESKDYAVLKIREKQDHDVDWDYFDLLSTAPTPDEEMTRGNRVYALGYPGIANYSFTDTQAVERMVRSERGRTITDHFNKEDFILTLTDGCISRRVTDAKGFSFFQHDAIISEGNSGGPLINANGVVLGINTARAAESEGYGIAVPINEVFAEIKDVLKD